MSATDVVNVNLEVHRRGP